MEYTYNRVCGTWTSKSDNDGHIIECNHFSMYVEDLQSCKVFFELPVQNIIAWTTLISRYVEP